MRWLGSLCALVIALALSGCAVIDAEKNNRGGFLDEMADEHWMKADSKKMRALRALAIEASLARIAMIAPKSAPDRALLAARIGSTSRRADVVRKCAFADAPILRGQAGGEPCFFFDSVMVDYENALFDLAIVALPLEEARALIGRVAGGAAAVSLNPLQLIQALLDLGREAFRYGRVVGAIYRDTLELEVQVWLDSPRYAESESLRGVSPEFIITTQRVAGLRAAYIRGNDNIPAWRTEIAALRAQGLEPIPHERFVAELYSILVYICGQIVSEKDDSYRQCALRPRDLMRGTALATGPGGALFGGIPGGGLGSEALRQRVQQQGQTIEQQRQELVAQGATIQRQLEAQRKLQDDIEKLKRAGTTGQPAAQAGTATQDAPSADAWAPYRATLCIEGEMNLGPRTIRAVRLFRAQVNNRPADTFDATLESLSETEKRNLDKARQTFGTCRSRELDPPRNPFEVALLSANSRAQVDGVLRTALASAKAIDPGIYTPASTEMDFNRAVKELRAAYRLAPPSDMNDTQIDDAFWRRARSRN